MLGGLSGGLIIDGLLEDNYPSLVGVRERVMLLKDIRLPGDSSGTPKTKTMNGQLNPTIPIAPGEVQFWRIGNVGADSYMNLSLSGVPFYILAIDGNLTGCVTLSRWSPGVCPVPATQYLLPPSSRVEVAVIGPPAGTYALMSQYVNTGPAGDSNPPVTLATVSSSSSSRVPQPQMAAARATLTKRSFTKATNVHPTPAALSRAVITKRITLVYTENTAGTEFFINGKQFDPSRVDTDVNVGDIVEFTIVNQTAELHTFHIHQTDFFVTQINGQPANSVSLQDNVNVPFMAAGIPGVVKVIVPFLDPVAIGKFVYHCHILEHEDGGMMATIRLSASNERTTQVRRRR
ncbi:MAG: multicopper oxidase domain-containing protein [Gemmatimonadaceae bacterium]|nr:multicopper oxidase domain-containing protein [Gemmatimonadaceae bacterium]